MGDQVFVGASIGIAYRPDRLRCRETCCARPTSRSTRPRERPRPLPALRRRHGRHPDAAAQFERTCAPRSRRRAQLAYQPVYAPTASDRRRRGAGRWDHPDPRPLPPAISSAIAEERGMIGPLGSWVLARPRDSRRHRLPWVAVNVSPLQLRDDVRGHDARDHRRCPVAPTRLQIEITESVAARR